MYEVGLTAPQVELDDETIIMYWYPDQTIEAKNKTEARKIVNKMIDNEEIDYDLMDENGDELSGETYRKLTNTPFPYSLTVPEIDYIQSFLTKR